MHAQPITSERRARRAWLSLLGLIVLMATSGYALRVVAGLPHLPDRPPTLETVRALLTGSTLPIAPLVSLVTIVAWALWLWIVGSLALELLVLCAESVARGASWAAGLRRVSDRVSVPLVRRAVAAAFAMQVLTRGVPVAAAQPLSSVELGVVVREDPPAPVAGYHADSHSTNDSVAVYRVQAGDTLWSIAQATFGSGTEYRRLVNANVGRRMPDGQRFTARGVIQPGWELTLPQTSQRVEEVDGQRWYTVQPGDTLWGIAARVLHNEERWSDLLELNRGATSPDGVHSLSDPNLIWPGLRLRLPDEDSPSVAEDYPPADTPAVPVPAPVHVTPPDRLAEARAAVAAAESELRTAAVPTAVVSELVPAAQDTPPPLLRSVHPLQPVSLEPAEASPQPTPAIDSTEPSAQPAPSEAPLAPLLAGAVATLAVAGAATLGVRRVRKLKPLSREPESDVVVHGGYAAAELTHEFTRGLQGGGFDPVVALVGQLRAFLAEYGLEHVSIVSVRYGRTSTTLTLAAGLSEQGLLLDLAPLFGTRIDAQAEASLSADQDVLLRVVRARKTRLLPSARIERGIDNLFVPLGVLPDKQILSGGWPSLGHVLVASLPGHGADVILTSLLCTLTARCSPHELRLWLISEPRALPAPVLDMPHLERIVDASDVDALDLLLEDLRHELDARAMRGVQHELVIVVPELAALGERGAAFELLTAPAAGLGVRILAASSTSAELTQALGVSHFSTRLVLHMDEEATSVSLLGVADAAFLGGGGRLLLRLDGREPVELFGFQVAPEHLERLVRVMRAAYTTTLIPDAPPGPNFDPPPEPEPKPEPEPEPSPGAPQLEAHTDNDEAPSGSTLSAVAVSAVEAKAPVQVFCFGTPRVLYRDKQVWPCIPGGEAKPWELLFFLACQPARGVARDQLVEALWPDGDLDADTMHRVRQLRYKLRTLFSQDGPHLANEGVVVARSNSVSLDPAIVHSDACEFLELISTARVTPVKSDDTIGQLERARDLYVGDLLEGPEVRRYAWVEERDASGVTLREHFRRQYQWATQVLAELYVASNQLGVAVPLYHELTELDPGDEANWLALFRVHAQRRDQPALLRAERRMRAALHELVVDVDKDGKSAPQLEEPSSETTLEFKRLLAELEAQAPQATAV